MSEKKPKPEFLDATKVYSQRTNVGGLTVYSNMLKTPSDGPDGSPMWCQTMVVDPTVRPMNPIVLIPHATMLDAVATHNAIVATMRVFEALVKSPLTAEIEALKMALIASETDLAKANEALEVEREKKKEVSSPKKKK